MKTRAENNDSYVFSSEETSVIIQSQEKLSSAFLSRIFINLLIWLVFLSPAAVLVSEETSWLRKQCHNTSFYSIVIYNLLIFLVRFFKRKKPVWIILFTLVLYINPTELRFFHYVLHLASTINSFWSKRHEKRKEFQYISVLIVGTSLNICTCL